MPELPEVETIGRALKIALSGRTIRKVEVFHPAMRTPLAPLLSAGLEGRRFTGVRRRARYLCADLDDGRCLLMHFGMSGVVRVEGAEVPRRKHEHVFIHLNDGMVFRFECVRRFSLLEVHTRGADGWPEALSGIGPEPLDDGGEYSGEYLYGKSRGVKTSAKVYLMDNATVAGIGNIYATETLFAAGIDPRRAAGRLTRKECGRLAEESRKILKAAIEQGGTTVSDFRHVDGSEGRFAVRLQVYGKSGGRCPKCGGELDSVKLGGRTSVFCPHCQK